VTRRSGHRKAHSSAAGATQASHMFQGTAQKGAAPVRRGD